MPTNYVPGQQLPGYQTNGFDPSVLPRGSNPDALTIDQVNIAMRASPVWNQWMAAHGHDPANVHLSDSDKNGLARTLELQGFPLPEGWEIDDSGNIREETHKGRNIAIAAAIAGAAFGGYALLAAYGAGAGAGAGTGAAAGMGGVEGAATSGIGASVASGTLGSAAAGNAALAAGVGGTAATAAPLASTTIGTGMMGTTAGAVPSGAVPAAMSGSGAATGAGTFSRIARGAQAARGIGGAISSATEASAENRRVQENAGLTANAQNIQGQSAFENELLARARLEEEQRKEDLRNVYRSSVAQNPHVSPFSVSGAPRYSQQYMDTIGSVAGQGASRLQAPRQYNTTGMPELRPYTPINPADVQGATGSAPGTMERIGQWVGPGLSAYSTLAQIYGW